MFYTKQAPVAGMFFQKDTIWLVVWNIFDFP